MKILEHVLNTIVREEVSINNMQFGFMPCRGTTDAIFILRYKKITCKRRKTSTLHLLT